MSGRPPGGGGEDMVKERLGQNDAWTCVNLEIFSLNADLFCRYYIAVAKREQCPNNAPWTYNHLTPVLYTTYTVTATDYFNSKQNCARQKWPTMFASTMQL
jgi:hypothetical protein